MRTSNVNKVAVGRGALPEALRTRAGAWFDPNLDCWAFREGVDNIHLDFARIPGCSPLLLTNLKLALAWYAESKSSKHLRNMFERFAHFARTRPAGVELEEVTSLEFINYGGRLGAKDEWSLAALSVLIRQWYLLGYPGVSAEAIKYLDEARLKRNKVGEAVRTRDPLHGPLTDLELEAVQAALNDSYAAGAIELDNYLLAWLFILLGLRPVQYAGLKVCDFKEVPLKDGGCDYILRIPRAKQRVAPRTVFTQRALTPQIGKVFAEYAKQIERDFEGRLPDVTQAPLFPSKALVDSQPEGFMYHSTADDLAGRATKVFARLQVVSERTGEFINLHPTRLRRTLGTRAATEGHGPLVIAELLDHTTTQSVGVYVEAVPEMVERLDRAMAMHLAPLAQAFAGVLVADESEAARGGGPASRIVDPRFDPTMRPMGSCGSHGFCGFMAPVACYTCKNFQPWLDGPHEAVLAHLLKERERLLPVDQRIASINDRTILAVAEVIQQCEVVKAQREVPANG